MTRTVRRFVVVLVVALALFGVFAASAFADLDSPPKDFVIGSTTTNPNPPPQDTSYADLWWRQGWGNSLFPQISLDPPESVEASVDGVILGILYTVDQNPGTLVDSTQPQNYDFSPYGNTTMNLGPYGPGTDGTFDLLTIAAKAGVQPEGSWYLHYKFVSSVRASTRTLHARFSMDVTPPDQVKGVHIATSQGGVTVADETTSTWTKSSRAVIGWTPGEQDHLSLVANAGVGYYQILVDGEPFVPEQSVSPLFGRTYAAPWLPHPASLTIETMPPGRHKVSVVAVDRATNESIESTPAYFESDPDTPTIKWLTPSGDTLVPAAKTVSVDTTDAAGDPTVVFSVNGSAVATVTGPPYVFDPDVSAYASDTPLVLRAKVIDQVGREVTITKNVTFKPNGVAGLTPSNDLDMDNWGGTSTTNPWYAFKQGDTQSDREGWGNSLNPEFTLNYPATAEGILYNVVMTTSTIDVSHPENYYRASKPSGTHTANTLDMQGIFAYPPTGGWRATPYPGAQSPIEGRWYYQWVFYDRSGNVSTRTYQGPFGIDITPPSPVTGLGVAPTPDMTPTASLVVAGSRVHLSWDASATYDTLSGVSYYKVLVDGQEVIPADGVVWDIPGSIPNAATLENLTPGLHTISVKAVDRAGNEGKPVSTTVFSDPDVPQITITKPSGGQVGVKTTFAATASDLGGVKFVVFKLDGSTVSTQTSEPYSANVDLSAFAAGTHVLTATVTDMYGRQVTATQSVTLDKTPLTISGFTRNYSLFYPIKRDKYYDNLTIAYKVNKACSASVLIRNSAGTIVRTLSKSAAVGKNTVTWDGKWSTDNKAHTGTFSLQVTASDAAGNTATSGKLTTTIRNYQVVKLSGNRVKIVAR